MNATFAAGFIERPGASSQLRFDGVDTLLTFLGGGAHLRLDGQEIELAANDAVYVPGGVPIELIAVAPAARIVVLQARGESAPPFDPVLIPVSTAVADKRAANDWTVKVDGRSAMRVGIYVLPTAGGGDAPQTHAVDEVNLVIEGSGLFRIGDETEITLEPWDVVYVPRTVSHRFLVPRDDIVDLIVFGR